MRPSDLYTALAVSSFVPSAIGIYDHALYLLVPVGYGLAIASIFVNRRAHREE